MSNIKTSKEQPSDSHKNLIEAIDAITKISGILVASLYFSGLVIVNAHFSRYGIAKVSLVNSKYVIAGVWYVVFVAICYRIYVELSGLFNREKPLSSSFATLLFALGHWYAIYIILNFVATRGSKLPSQMGMAQVFTYAWFALGAIGAVLWLFSSIWKKQEPRIKAFANWILATNAGVLALAGFSVAEILFFLTIFFLIRLSFVVRHDFSTKRKIVDSLASWFFVLLFSFWLFGRYIYAEIYSAFGGGNLVPVELKIKDVASNEESKIHSLKGKLIDRTDTGFVMTIDSLQNIRAVEFSAESVLMVSYSTDYFETPSMSKLMKWIEKKSMKTQIDSIHSASSIDSTSSKK